MIIFATAMKLKETISSPHKAFPSLEIVPPLKGVSKKELVDSIMPFMEFNPPFINITCHRDEYRFSPLPDGSFSRMLVRNRVSQTAVCAAVQAAFPQVEVVPHLICAGTTAELIESQLQDLKFLGINNVVALRGDSIVGEKRFTPEPGGYRFASEMVGAIRSFDQKFGTDFSIGVAGYPEKHFEAPNIDADIANLKHKVDQGADFIITQMFFDNRVFYEFRQKCLDAGIKVPIIPGLKPLSTIRQIDLIPQSFSLDIPQDLVTEMRTHSANAYAIGMEWCADQCRDLLKHDVPAVHFYTMGKPDNVTAILKKFF